jgi:hypothetical protein
MINSIGQNHDEAIEGFIVLSRSEIIKNPIFHFDESDLKESPSLIKDSCDFRIDETSTINLMKMDMNDGQIINEGELRVRTKSILKEELDVRHNHYRWEKPELMDFLPVLDMNEKQIKKRFIMEGCYSSF